MLVHSRPCQHCLTINTMRINALLTHSTTLQLWKVPDTFHLLNYQMLRDLEAFVNTTCTEQSFKTTIIDCAALDTLGCPKDWL